MVQPSTLRFISEAALAANQSAQDVIIADHGSRVDDLEVLGGLAPGDTSDATVHNLVNNPASLTSIELAGKYVSKGSLVVNVKDYGAVGNGTTDDTAAIIAAEAAANTAGATLFMPPGTYKTTGKITFRVATDASNATIKYYGAGTALVVGNDTATGLVTYRKKFKLPSVILGDNTVPWDGTSTGVILLNLNTCDVYVPWVGDFENGLKCYGQGTGFAYNTVFLGHLGQNHKNLILTQDETGWANQNTFVGGKIVMNNARGAVKDDVNASQISLVKGSTTVSGPNNNTFVGVSLEGENWAKYRVTFDGARFNTFLNCRWEVMVDANSLVRYLNGSADNRIIGGYDSAKINEEFDATSPGGTILDGQGGYLQATIPTGSQLIPNNVYTTVTAWSSISSRRIAYNATTGVFTPRPGRWRITATIAFAPNATGRRRCNAYTSNGITIDFAECPGNAQRTTMKLNGVFKFSGTETFVIQVDQNSGADLLLEGSANYVTLKAELLGV